VRKPHKNEECIYQIGEDNKKLEKDMEILERDVEKLQEVKQRVDSHTQNRNSLFRIGDRHERSLDRTVIGAMLSKYLREMKERDMTKRGKRK
jgi:hypothetical protein